MHINQGIPELKFLVSFSANWLSSSLASLYPAILSEIARNPEQKVGHVNSSSEKK